MSVYTLSGAGTQGLSAGVTHLRVDVITFPQIYSTGRATPVNYFDLGLLRLGNQGSYYATRPIDSSAMILDVPGGVTTLGYSLFGATSVRVTEVIDSVSWQKQPWDRNPTSIGLAFSSAVPGGTSDTVAFTYTVPANRLMNLQYALGEIDRYTTPSGLGFGYVYVVAGGNTLFLTYGNPANQGQNIVEGPSGLSLTLKAGQQIVGHYQNADTGGQMFMSVSAGGVEFDL